MNGHNGNGWEQPITEPPKFSLKLLEGGGYQFTIMEVEDLKHKVKR